MISLQEAADLVQSYMNETLMKSRKAWDFSANRKVETAPEPIKVYALYPASFGYTATYNTVPPTLGGNHPLFVSADGSEVREATWREVWQADPDAFPHLRSRMDELGGKEEQSRAAPPRGTPEGEDATLAVRHSRRLKDGSRATPGGRLPPGRSQPLRKARIRDRGV